MDKMKIDFHVFFPWMEQAAKEVALTLSHHKIGVISEKRRSYKSIWTQRTSVAVLVSAFYLALVED